ncbi:very long chain fatty acid elongase F-like [Drosophila bipectinata]|uniref:very long chain fatty acid elongase F-like n=1 Tax=Drosophila bipectinata TaxID=42026 RepID=UPI001C8915D5|nr:elongation of very long chain fatty acids protein F-like [Drosophila bipectinata]
MLSPVDPATLSIFSSPWPTLITLLSYLLFVLKVGPRLMKNREPFDLRRVIKVYNIFQIIYNIWMLVHFVNFLFVLKAYDLGCMTTLPLDHEHKDAERYYSNLYLINKFVDLVETIFFVLRKKDRQISVLHLFHHASMPLVVFLFTTLHGYGGVATAYALLNIIVHILMYTYYYLSTVSKAAQQSLWWKKYITIAQMVQFGIVLALNTYTLSQPNCKVPRFQAYICGVLSLSLFVLFGNFYVRAYILSDRKRRQ